MAGKRPIGIDLFCGAGGMSLGFEQAGFDIVAAVDVDPIHCAVHEFNFPKCKSICASVADLKAKDIRIAAGIDDAEIDVVFGGAPCQGFSMIGKRALDDPRNSLVFHFVRLIKELKPKAFVFENVKGLTVGDHKKFLNEIIEALDKIGYAVERDYRVLNAADFGVPQDRRRLFLIGTRRGLAKPGYPTPKSTQGSLTEQPSLLDEELFPTPTVWEAIGDLPSVDKFASLLKSDSLKTKLKKPSRYAEVLRGSAIDHDDFSYVREHDDAILTSSMRTIHTKESMRRFRGTEPGTMEPISRFLKLDPNGICNTLRAGTDSQRGAHTSPRPIHPFEPRVITVREAARLHSYPDWFRMHVTKWHGFRQVGNSVPPMLARAVGAEILKAIGYRSFKPKIKLALGSESLLAFNMSQAADYYGVSKKVIPQRIRNFGKIAEEASI